MSEQSKQARRAFLAAELAYRKACLALWEATGTTNANWETKTQVELTARRYCDAADAYRSQTRALFQGKTKGPSDGKPVSPPHSNK